MKIRLHQKEVFYPYFKTEGRNMAVFYDYTLFESETGTPATEQVFIPLLNRKFKGGNARSEGVLAIAQKCEKATGRAVIFTDSAMSQAWGQEPRASTGINFDA